MGHISFGDALDWDGTHYPNPSSAIDGAINMVSTSRYTAKSDPVELTETTDRVRYRFLATNVDNPKDPSHCVEGKFVYERKRKGDASFPSDSAETELGPVSRGMLQRKGFNGDWLELTLDTGETRRLYEALDARYRIQQESGGVQGGSTTYVPLDRSVSSLLKMMRENPSETRLLAGGNNFELVKEMIRLMTQGTTREQLSEIFSELEKGHLDDFTVSLSLAQLEKAEKEIAENLGNGNEEYWQRIFTDHQWILSQVFSAPCTLLQGKAYVGGKAIDNSGGNICDLLYQNELTSNVTLIEIKTPLTTLLGTIYRGKEPENAVYSLTSHMSGAVNQVLNYRDTLTKEYYMVNGRSSSHFEALSPKCVVVIGKISELDTAGKKATFEHYRNNLSDVTVVTFDELLQRIRDLIAVLRTGNEATSTTSGIREPDLAIPLQQTNPNPRLVGR